MKEGSDTLTLRGWRDARGLASRLIIAFDQGERDKLQPITLRMRPCQISKAGKKRTHTPTNSELRGSGLTIAKTQPHLAEQHDKRSERPISSLDRWVKPPPASAKTALCPQSKHQLQAALEQAVRNTVAMQNGKAPQNGERNLDPDRSDGLVVPKRRVARAMVSTAPKGSVPTTLGGKLPPVSILSRREFGLRVLRK